MLLAVVCAAQVRADSPAELDGETVTYPAGLFERYRPVNALDMVEQVPGFQIDNGGTRRGFGGTPGNVLINGERPSSKTDSVTDILQRIPAARVVRIDLIRGNTGRFDGGGQDQLVNVIVDADRRSWAWEGTVEQDPDSGGPTPAFNLSLLDRSGNTDWGLGMDLATSYVGNAADETVFDRSGPIELRDEFERSRNQSVRLNGNTSTGFGADRLRLNLELSFSDSDFRENSRRTPLSAAPPFNLDQRSDSDDYGLEFGGDYEWTPAPDWSARLITLVRRERTDDLDQQLIGPDRGRTRIRQQSRRRSVSAETIGRIELEWSALDRHLLEIDFETALNRLDNELELLGESGGRLAAIPVPGANNEVEELRGELALRDTWTLGRFSLESALELEASEISQTGSSVPDKQFFFAKPSLTLVHTPAGGRIDRLEFRREVAQLDFNDFVSSTNFADQDIDRGNPDLEPQQDWLMQGSSERRFGAIGSLRLTLFHRWVRDVQDRLPIDRRFEVPGNIGDGRRWGVQLEATLPLNRLGMGGRTRLDLDARWEDSSVSDPLTGSDRRFSGQRRYTVESTLRQDLTALRLAWGLEAEYETSATAFELEEIDRDQAGLDLEPFIETTRYLGVKLRLTVQNLLDRKFERDRRVFAPDRDLGELRFRELRDRRRGRSVLLSVSGAF